MIRLEPVWVLSLFINMFGIVDNIRYMTSFILLIINILLGLICLAFLYYSFSIFKSSK